MSNPLDTQVGGGHYKDLKIQPVEFIHANGLGFMEGAVIKYVARHKAKNGRQDLEKAIHFLQLLLELEYPEAAPAESHGVPAISAHIYWHQCQCGNGFESFAETSHCLKCDRDTQGRWRG